MEKKFTYSQFARALSIPQATVGNNVKRGKLIGIIENNKKLIDISNPLNKIWLETQLIKGKVFDINLVFNPPPKEKKEKIKEEKKEEIKKIPKGDASVLQIKKMKLEVIKLENDDKYKKLQIQKMEGKLIPFDAASDIFLYAIESYRTTFLQNIKSISNIFAQRLGADHAQFVDIQQKISDIVKDITQEAKDNVVSGLDGAVKEYAEVRGVGEKK